MRRVILAAVAAVALLLVGSLVVLAQDGDLFLPLVRSAPPTPTATQPPPTSTPVPPPPTATLPPATPTESVATWDCSYDRYNCSNFSTQAQAQAVFDYCWAVKGFDVHKLDFDNNMIACESLP